MKSAKKYAQKVAHGAMVGRLSVAQNMYQDVLDKADSLAAENAALRKQISPFTFNQRDGRLQEGLIAKGSQAEGNPVRADAIERTNWVGLTDDERIRITDVAEDDLDAMKRAEAILKEKNT